MKLPYLQYFRDCQGKPRCYVRDTIAKKQIAILAAPGSPEFMPLYQAALADLRLIPATRQTERQRIMYRANAGAAWEQSRAGRVSRHGRLLRGFRTNRVGSARKVSKAIRPKCQTL